MKNFQFTFLQAVSFPVCLIERRRAKTCLWSIVCGLMFLGTATASFAQAPGWSRGQQNLAITYDDCVRRMPAALQAEGYGRDPNSGGNFVAGTKGFHTAVIICSPAPDARMLVQIVVASNGDGGGLERQRLQAQMERPGAGGCGELQVMRAVYGEQGKFNDVTQRLQSLIRGVKLNVTVTNDSMGGDPNFGVLKKLYIKYKCGGKVSEKTTDENATLTIP